MNNNFDIKKLIGMKKEDVIDLLERNKIEFRISKENEKWNVMTAEFKPDRINLLFDKDILIEFNLG